MGLSDFDIHHVLPDPDQGAGSSRPERQPKPEPAGSSSVVQASFRIDLMQGRAPKPAP